MDRIAGLLITSLLLAQNYNAIPVAVDFKKLSNTYSHTAIFNAAEEYLLHHRLEESNVNRSGVLIQSMRMKEEQNILLTELKNPNRITILHTNDIHAHLDEFNRFGLDCHSEDITNNECFGGIARMKTVVDNERAMNKNVLFLDAGDQFQGTLFYTFFKGEKISYMMNNILKYDLMTIGNHEFDDGERYLAKFLKSLNFPIVSSNIDLNDAVYLRDSKVVKPYVIFEDYQLGVIGFITNGTAGLTPNAANIRFYNPVVPVQRYVDELHSLGIKRIICVSHNGYNDDKFLAENTRGISLIVGGHSHSLLHNIRNDSQVMGPYPTKVRNLDKKTTYIVQAYQFGQFMGKVDIEFNDENELISLDGDPILLDNTISKHEETDVIVKKWRIDFDAQTKHIVGEAMDNFPFSSCKISECALGNLVADSLLIHQRLLKVDADVAFISDGGLRAGFRKGNITTADILTILPFPNQVVYFPMSGQEILTSLEYIAAGRNGIGQKILTLCHWSGLHYSYNSSAPFMEKINSVYIMDHISRELKALNLKRVYTVVASDFLAAGGDSILSPRDGVAGKLVSEIFQDHIESMKSISPLLEQRIIKLL